MIIVMTATIDVLQNILLSVNMYKTRDVYVCTYIVVYRATVNRSA